MAIGITAEFNPFHNGHRHLIAEAKRLSGEAAAVAVMSGAWVQRGGAAITDKHTRARAALENGIDLVFELPVIYSMNTAQKFAYGAVATLAASGIVTSLAFGSECGSAKALSAAADALINEPPAVSERIKTLVSGGMSYAAARSAAYEGIIERDLLSSPNDILAIEYLRAARELGAELDIYAIPRLGAEHDGEPQCGIASAAVLRKMLAEGRDISEYTALSDFPVYDAAALDTAVIALLRTCGAEYLRGINDVSEGLENRFIKAAMECGSIAELCEKVKSKRYAMSRIRRIAYSALLGLTKELAATQPAYIRVLGMNKRGAALLREMKDKAALPVITKSADFGGDEIFAFNSRAEDIFALCAPTHELKRGGRDLSTSPVVLNF